VINPTVGVQPLVAFQPLPDPVLTVEGSESEGPSGFTESPPQFPAGLNHGFFIGFHGIFEQGGTTNDENPFVFVDPSTGHYFDFISNNEPNIGHIDEALSTSDSLFLADISSGGSMETGVGQGMIYQIQAITSQGVNHPPVLASIPDQTVNEGVKLTVQVSATDPDAGQTITYGLGSGAPTGAAIDPQSGVFTWTPNAYSGSGTYSITVTATDNGSPPLSDSTAFTINVLPVNHPPNFLSIPAQIVERTVALQVPVQEYVSDPDIPAQTLHYSLASGAPTGAAIDPDSGLFTWAPASDVPIGSYTIGAIVTDTGSPPLSASMSFTVNVVPFNHPPVLAAIPTQTVDEGSPLSLSVTATDPDLPAEVLSYSLAPGAPAGMQIDSHSGLLTWTPDPYAGSGLYSVTVEVTDNGPIPKSDSATFVVDVKPVNHRPVISPLPSQTIGSGLTLELAVAPFVSDLDKPAQTLRYSLGAGAPAGAGIDPVSGLITWAVPTSQHIGTYAIGVVVTDSGLPPLSQTANLIVDVYDPGRPATVQRATVRIKHGYAITLTFSQSLDPVTADDPNNYVLTPQTRKSKKGPPPIPIPLTAAYNAASRTVTLTALGSVNSKRLLRLTVIGTGPAGVAKVTGLLLAGSRGRPGTDYVATITGKLVKH
jgi:hypothetical protein